MTDELDARTAQFQHDTEIRWVERWRDEDGGLTLIRFNARTTLVMFGGSPHDDCAPWLAEQLPRLLEGEQQLHFIDQHLLDRPSTAVRNLYMSALKQHRASLEIVHIFVGDKPLLKMITSAANMVFGGLGHVHDELEDFDQALRGSL